MEDLNVEEILMSVGTVDAINLLRSYKVGGMQLESYMIAKSDMVAAINKTHPGFKKHLMSKV